MYSRHGLLLPRRYFCSGLSALNHRWLPAKLPALHNTALLLLHIAAHKGRPIVISAIINGLRSEWAYRDLERSAHARFDGAQQSHESLRAEDLSASLDGSRHRARQRHSVSGVRVGEDLSSLRNSCSANYQNSASRSSGRPACSQSLYARASIPCLLGSGIMIAPDWSTAPPACVVGTHEQDRARPAWSLASGFKSPRNRSFLARCSQGYRYKSWT